MPSSDTSSRAPYGAADRLLHHLALGSRAVMETSFDIERARFAKRAREAKQGPPVFVCGLARAGTTVFMRLLHGSGAFSSPTYRDMPFPLAPNSWARLTGKRSVAASERGHGDGLTHDLDSPEAIEEVFWRCFEGEKYIHPDGLKPVPPEQETIDRLRDYAALVCLRHGAPRYLSKNNNNILRLEGLVRAFPNSVLVHPFRHPEQQAASLLNQHLRARELHEADPFRRRYMAWLGHHEFGGDHRPFLLGGHSSAKDDLSLDYWLAAWTNAYRHLLAQGAAVGARQVFLDYDAACENPAAVATLLAERVGLPTALIMAELHPPARHAATGCDPTLLAKAREIHDQLKART